MTIDQDVYGLEKDAYDLNLSQAWLKFNKPFNKYFDLTVGMQDIKIEKTLLIGVGRLQESAIWSLFNQSFPFGVRLEGAFGPFKTDIFWAESKKYWQKFDEGIKDDVGVAGINIHYDISEKSYIYGGFYRKIDDGKKFISSYSPQGSDLYAENDTNNFDIGLNIETDNFVIEGEYVYQTGDAGKLGTIDLDRDAYSFFVSSRYTLPLMFSPFIRSSYFYFSGDDDIGDDNVKDYDPMFSGWVSWNRWVMGELTGEAHLPNSNKRVFILEAGFSPFADMTVTLMYMKHKLVHKHYLNSLVSSSDWGDEVNLLTDWHLNDNMFLHLGLGYVVPGNAAKEVFKDNKNAFFSQIFLDFSF